MKYLYLDTETGGVNNRTDALLTIGLVAHDDVMGIMDTAHILVKPEGLLVAERALEINHIELASHTAEAVTREEAANLMRLFIRKNFGSGYLNKPYLVGHNIGFDRGFIDPLFPEGDLPFSYRNLDTMGIALFLFDLGILPSAKNLKLDFLLDYYKVEISEADRHTALGDALVTRLVHLAMREEIRSRFKSE